MRPLLSIRSCLLLAFLPVLALAQKVNVEFDEAANFSQYKTFAIRQGQLNSKAPALNNDLVRKNIETAIRKLLTEKGLVETENRPDLNVRYSLGSGRRTQVEAYPAGWRGLGTRLVRVPYTEGTFVLDLRDAKQRSLVWRAIAVEDKTDPMKIREKLDDMIKKSIDKYPPKQR